MARPVIFAIDDDPEVLRTIDRDLRSHFGRDYRILRADSGASALEALRELRRRNEAVALLLSDQKMPGLPGVEFLEQARQLFPDARRALLTAYADTDAAIRAINSAKIDYYLLKPWDPPDEKLYPVLEDLLAAWQADFRPPFEGLRVIGHRWSPLAHEVKDFLARNQVPYGWLDIESDAQAQAMLDELGLSAAELPVVLFPDGGHIVRPALAQLAERIGLKTRATTPFFDLIIVGAGPAGLAAAVYGASEGLATLLIERSAPGGQAGQSSRIENYLGFPSGLSGAELTRRAVAQAERFGAEILRPQEVVSLRSQATYHLLQLADQTELSCHALLIATGVAYRKLEVPGVESLTGAGVYYGAAMSEANACRDNDVYVVGAGNSAGQAAMYLSKFARQVSLLVRGHSIAESMSHYLVQQLREKGNIVVRTQAEVTAAQGDHHLESLTIRDCASGREETVPAAALFIFIGAAPHTAWVGDAVQRDTQGYIVAGPDLIRNGKPPAGWPLRRAPFWLETSVPGIFVAGDVRSNAIKRVASAVGEGAMAVAFVHKFLATLGAS